MKKTSKIGVRLGRAVQPLTSMGFVFELVLINYISTYKSEINVFIIVFTNDFLDIFLPDEIPPAEQMKTAKALIAAGVELGYIKSDYKLVGHRQVRATECPGEALFKEIQTWDHYSKHPSSVSELIDVPELPVSVKAILLNSTSCS